MNRKFIFILWVKWHVANFDMPMWCQFGWHMSSSNLINLMTLIWNLPLNFDVAFCNWLDKFLPPTNAPSRLVHVHNFECGKCAESRLAWCFLYAILLVSAPFIYLGICKQAFLQYFEHVWESTIMRRALLLTCLAKITLSRKFVS